MKSKLPKIFVILDKVIFFKSKSGNLVCFSEHREASTTICYWIKHKTKPQK